MIVSLVYRAARPLLVIPGIRLRRDTAKDTELPVLRNEDVVLRRQLNGPVRYEPADRFWLSALSSPIPRCRWSHIFPVTPGTLLVWHRRLLANKRDCSARRGHHGRGQQEQSESVDGDAASAAHDLLRGVGALGGGGRAGGGVDALGIDGAGADSALRPSRSRTRRCRSRPSWARVPSAVQVLK